MSVSRFRYIIFAFIALALAPLHTAAAEPAATDFSYRPNVHGTLRPRYEILTESGESRFMVRNARIILNGFVAPQVDYFMQVDFCAKGKIMPLDFWARLAITPALKIQAGQFRMPFGVDPFRAPHTYFFANRSFLARDMCNYRAVGCKLTYSIPGIPLSAEAGLFNPYTIPNHEVWSKKMSGSARLLFTSRGVKLSAGFMSVAPERVRANLTDFTAGWSDSRWTVEGEVMHEHYTLSAHKAAWSYTLFANYGMPIKAGMFNRMSFQGRFDGITDYSNLYDTDGALTTTVPSRRRITLGTTITHFNSANLFVDLRLNYEKFFYHKDSVIPEGQNDKVVAELVVRF